MALLGTAGLVAGIKPANLAIPSTVSRGSTPANPIVVEDEEKHGYTSFKMKPNASRTTSGVCYSEQDPPRLGKRSDSMTPSLEIDPESLPVPTNKEIVAMLIGQKDIFPVLQGILRLVAGQKAEQLAVASASPAPALPSKRHSRRRSEHQTPTPPTGLKAPPLKRRKLNRVPAGAADWDVPYPFQDGEGPEEYRQTWEKERGKQLVSQLVNLIRTAVRKAATKKFLQQEGCHQAVPKAVGQPIQSQRSHSAPAALKEVVQSESVISDTSKLSTQIEQSPLPQPEQPEASPTAAHSPDFASPVPETSLDQLISTLLAASYPSGVADTRGNGICETGAGAVFDVNDGLIDSWMNVFETFPIPSDGFASALDTSCQKQPPSTCASVPDFHLSDMTSTLDFDLVMHATPLSESINIPIIVPFPHLPSDNALEEDAEQFLRDIGLEPIPTSHSTQYQSIDDIINDPTPSTLSQSQPQPPVYIDQINDLMQNDQTSEETGEAPALLVPSPIPSASSVSSVGDADPSTPTSALWESGTPDIVFAQHNQDPSLSQGERQRHVDDEGSETRRFTAQEKEKWKENGKTNEDREKLDQDGGTEQASTTAATMLVSTPFQISMEVSPMPPVEENINTASSLLGAQSDPGPAQKTLNKQEIIRLAQERRRQLVEELERVKMQLWETTIEQSVLIELQREALP